MTEQELNSTFKDSFIRIYQECGEPPSIHTKKEEDFESYWNNCIKLTKDYVSSIFNDLNKGNVFCLTLTSTKASDGSKNMKIMKLGEDSYYIISNDFRMDPKFNSKPSLDINDINELLAVDVMYIYNSEAIREKWTPKITIL